MSSGQCSHFTVGMLLILDGKGKSLLLYRNHKLNEKWTKISHIFSSHLIIIFNTLRNMYHSWITIAWGRTEWLSLLHKRCRNYFWKKLISRGTTWISSPIICSYTEWLWYQVQQLFRSASSKINGIEMKTLKEAAFQLIFSIYYKFPRIIPWGKWTWTDG